MGVRVGVSGGAVARFGGWASGWARTRACVELWFKARQVTSRSPLGPWAPMGHRQHVFAPTPRPSQGPRATGLQCPQAGGRAYCSPVVDPPK
eukprot:13380216-Alexandrium_andersonii.AAC.1